MKLDTRSKEIRLRGKIAIPFFVCDPYLVAFSVIHNFEFLPSAMDEHLRLGFCRNSKVKVIHFKCVQISTEG